jgi:penicillin-binding protein 1A
VKEEKKGLLDLLPEKVHTWFQHLFAPAPKPQPSVEARRAPRRPSTPPSDIQPRTDVHPPAASAPVLAEPPLLPVLPPKAPAAPQNGGGFPEGEPASAPTPTPDVPSADTGATDSPQATAPATSGVAPSDGN